MLSLSLSSMTYSVSNKFGVIPPWCFSHVFPPYLKDPHLPFCMIESFTLNLTVWLKLPSLIFFPPSQGRNISHFCGLECSLSILTWQLLRVQGNIFVFLCVFLLGENLKFLKGRDHRSFFFLTVAIFPHMVAKHL